MSESSLPTGLTSAGPQKLIECLWRVQGQSERVIADMWVTDLVVK